jgi:glycosyltransferase involved in cell wall biosynthesis
VVSGTGGGPEKTILNSPRFLQEAGYRTLCAYMHPPNDPGFEEIQRKAQALGAAVFSVEDRGPWDWQVVSQFLKVCRNENVTIWHGHDYKSNALGILLRRLVPMKLVTTVHGWVKHTRRTPFYYYLDRLCLPRYDKVICVSQDLYEAVLACGVPGEKCILIENAIDTRDFCRTRSVAEAKIDLGIESNRLVLGAIGRLSSEKAFDVLIQATDHLLKRGIDLELFIIGEGDEKSRLEELISRLGWRERMHLLGYRSDVKAYYQAMDVFVLSSLREGLPNVLLEALALEVPVVASRVAGVPRLITDKINGLLVEPGSVKDLEEKLATLLLDEELRGRLRQLGRDIVKKFFSFDVRMRKVQAVYDELLERKSQPLRESYYA